MNFTSPTLQTSHLPALLPPLCSPPSRLRGVVPLPVRASPVPLVLTPSSARPPLPGLPPQPTCLPHPPPSSRHLYSQPGLPLPSFQPDSIRFASPSFYLLLHPLPWVLPFWPMLEGGDCRLVGIGCGSSGNLRGRTGKVLLRRAGRGPVGLGGYRSSVPAPVV